MLRPVLGRILAKIGPKTVDKTGPIILTGISTYVCKALNNKISLLKVPEKVSRQKLSHPIFMEFVIHVGSALYATNLKQY